MTTISVGSKVEIRNALRPGARGFRGVVVSVNDGGYATVTGYGLRVPCARLDLLPDDADIDNTDYRARAAAFAGRR